jgi:hypothetical protein
METLLKRYTIREVSLVSAGTIDVLKLNADIVTAKIRSSAKTRLRGRLEA